MGEDYPVEVAASSSCDWPLLGLLTARLRLRPGQLLVDAGCGAGGIGLWLARALAVRLTAFDLWPLQLAPVYRALRKAFPSSPSATASNADSLTPAKHGPVNASG
ncbi:hypothetical protein AB0N43_16085 [Streptomyces pseudogriseolus]|uniref:SAM-dependent methyltransferase n=1 Tax=Streptomyces pseudogriseolus TaxID=36817 RepID=UPI00347B7A45